MILSVNATIRGLGDCYADGNERIEIHISLNHARELPYSMGARVPITLNVGGKNYVAGLRATENNNYFGFAQM
jgi:hypothetical protein